MIHHGLCSLSAYAKSKGFAVELIDLRKLRGWADFKREIKRHSPDIVGITSRSLEYNIVRQCFEIIKEVNPKIITVIGGIHPTVALEEVRKEKNIDHIIIGEGELSFAELLTRIRNGLKSERVIVGKRPDLDSLPFVDRELFDYSAELANPFLPDILGFQPPFVTILTSRGCKYNCSFCQPSERKAFGPKVRRRSVANVIAELIQLRDKYHFNSLMIHDDSMTQDEGWVREFCMEYQRNGFTQPFFAQSRADFICQHEEIVALMAEAGLRGLSIGFESGNDRVLRFLRKGVMVEQNYKAAEICRKYGIKIYANYMLGMPTETKEEVMDTIHMIKQIRPDYHSCSFFTPLLGTDLYDYCIKNDLCLIRNHAMFDRGLLTPKIRGVDYNFLLWAADEAQDLPPWKRLVRKLQRVALINRVVRYLTHFRPIRALMVRFKYLLRQRSER